MFEGSMKSFGWGYVGSNVKGFEWLFTPDAGDPAYLEDPATGKPYSCCCVGVAMSSRVKRQLFGTGKAG